MSINLPSSGGGASASDVWSYSTRTLTQTFSIIERANGYSSSGTKIYDATRAYNAILQVYGSGYGAIAEFPSEDIAPSKTFTQLSAPYGGSTGYSFPTTLVDHNDSTYIQWNTAEDMFSIDLGSQMNVFIRAYSIAYSSGISLTIYGSNDNTNWTQIASLSVSTTWTESIAFISGYRYLKFNTNGNMSVASIEIYPASSLPYSRTLSYNGRLKVFALGFYQLLEVVKV